MNTLNTPTASLLFVIPASVRRSGAKATFANLPSLKASTFAKATADKTVDRGYSGHVGLKRGQVRGDITQDDITL